MNPRLRFKKADGTDYPDWEEKKFNDVFDCFEYGLNASATKYDGKNKYIRITDIDEEARTYSYNDVVSPNCELDDKYLVKENDILFARTGASVGKTYLYRKSDGILYFAGFLIRGHVNQKFDSRFIFQSTLSEEFKIWIKVNSVRTGQPGINSQQYASYKLHIPCLEEQKKIGSFLSDIDEVILASDQEVKKLQELKKGAMQKIFSQEVRFKRDDGTDYPDWEEKNFNDVFEFLNNNTFSRDMLTYENAIVKNIHYGDILIKFGNICDIECDNLPFIKPEFETSRYNLLKNGDIIIADTAEDDTVGKAIEIYNLNNNKVISGLHTMACRPIMFFSPKYLGYYINSFLFHEQLKPYMQGIKVTSVNRKNIVNTMIKYPFSLEEQEKIGDFLSDFDEAISLAKQELEKWKLLKKGLLQQMFV